MTRAAQKSACDRCGRASVWCAPTAGQHTSVAREPVMCIVCLRAALHVAAVADLEDYVSPPPTPAEMSSPPDVEGVFVVMARSADGWKVLSGADMSRCPELAARTFADTSAIGDVLITASLVVVHVRDASAIAHDPQTLGLVALAGREAATARRRRDAKLVRMGLTTALMIVAWAQGAQKDPRRAFEVLFHLQEDDRAGAIVLRAMAETAQPERKHTEALTQELVAIASAKARADA